MIKIEISKKIKENPTGFIGIILGILVPILGIVLGVLSLYLKEDDERVGHIAVAVGIIVWIIRIFLITLM